MSYAKSFSLGGRKTPVDSSLQPINESPRPIPRSRQAGSPKDRNLPSPKESRFKSTDSSPRCGVKCFHICSCFVVLSFLK